MPLLAALGEIGSGLCAMPAGRRRDALEERLEQFIARAFDDRVLAFDQAAARSYGVELVNPFRPGQAF